MVRVIGIEPWFKWCTEREIDPAATRFALETCYYGTGLRSRPGTLIVTEHAVIHHSYDVGTTLWAIFEREERIVLPLADVAALRRPRMGWLLKVSQMYPAAHFELHMRDGRRHDLVLQRDADAFAAVLRDAGIPLAAA